MCGRYVISSSPETIRKLFGYAEQPNFPPRYNVAPTQPIPVVRLDTLGTAALIVPAPDGSLECYEVSPAVNRVANDDARLVEPLTGTKSDMPAAEPRRAKRQKRDDQPSLF